MQRLVRAASWSGWVLAAVGLMTACSDNVTNPLTTDAPAAISAYAGNDQSAVVGTAVATAPTVKVTDASGGPIAGVTVHFTVVTGGGVIASATGVTNAQGIASAGTWTLGPDTGPNVVQAAVTGLTPVEFSATATSAFNIDVRYLGSAGAAERAAVDSAVATWRAAIIGDLPDIRISAPANDCFDGQPAIDEVVDDLVLYVQVTQIDGAGKVLAESGPCYVRTQGTLPALGVLMLDAADVPLAQAHGVLRDLVTHEIGHVLGFGTIWSDLNLLTGAGGSDPRFQGASAIGAYQALGGVSGGVPVENQGDDGTRDSHWRESIFGNELMTGYLNMGSNPLSAMSIQSLHDLGYVTDPSTADPYTLPVASPQGAKVIPPRALDVTTSEILIKPRRSVGN